MREEFLSELVGLEAPPNIVRCSCCREADGCLRCKDCFDGEITCQKCCLTLHRQLPFHRLERWADGFFRDTSLYREGHVLHLGHGGNPCPVRRLPEFDDYMEQDGGPTVNEDMVEMLDGWEDLEADVIVIVDCSGVYQRRIGWCNCREAPARYLQLLRSRLYPASLKRPKTAFTFNVLEYFHVDAVECKTSAMNFFTKLRRLSNYMVPDSVPVNYHLAWFVCYSFAD